MELHKIKLLKSNSALLTDAISLKKALKILNKIGK